jgi:D-alanine--poly(phosphoribitol) ligase subunit 2
MNRDPLKLEMAIKERLIEICEALGEDARTLEPTDLIPASGLIDSAGLLELLAWYEDHFEISLAPEEITIDNLGTIRLMVEFALKRMRAG